MIKTGAESDTATPLDPSLQADRELDARQQFNEKLESIRTRVVRRYHQSKRLQSALAGTGVASLMTGIITYYSNGPDLISVIGFASMLLSGAYASVAAANKDDFDFRVRDEMDQLARDFKIRNAPRKEIVRLFRKMQRGEHVAVTLHGAPLLYSGWQSDETRMELKNAKALKAVKAPEEENEPFSLVRLYDIDFNPLREKLVLADGFVLSRAEAAVVSRVKRQATEFATLYEEFRNLHPDERDDETSETVTKGLKLLEEEVQVILDVKADYLRMQLDAQHAYLASAKTG